MMIPLRDGTDYEIPPDFLAELGSTYYNLDDELRKMRLWLLANPDRRKTRAGVKRFINNWFRDKPLKPIARSVVMDNRLPAEPLETRLNHLSRLKEALK